MNRRKTTYRIYRTQTSIPIFAVVGGKSFNSNIINDTLKKTRMRDVTKITNRRGNIKKKGAKYEY